MTTLASDGLCIAGHRIHLLHSVLVWNTQTQEVTRSWIDRQFPDMFAAVHFGNHWGLSGEKRTKSEMCVEEGAFCLIDDSVKYATECASVLDSTLLFGTYPWNVDDNQEADALPNVHRVKGWSDVLARLM